MDTNVPLVIRGEKRRNKDQIEYLEDISKEKSIKEVYHPYGTAGFRGLALYLDTVASRVGVIAALRALSLDNIPVVGIMITASHNPHYDNGLKIIEPDGGMLDMSWEQIAVEFINANVSTLETALEELQQKVGINIIERVGPSIFVGRDTRSSSESLSCNLIKTLQLCNCTTYDYGLLTTPQLHWMVGEKNYRDTNHIYINIKLNDDISLSKIPNLNEYYCHIQKYFYESTETININDEPLILFIDCSFGVGSFSATIQENYLKDNKHIKLIPFNTDTTRTTNLNKHCGSDYVQKENIFPCNLEQLVIDKKSITNTIFGLSFDGDADRIVFYNGQIDTDEKKLCNFILLDGDRISTQISLYINQLRQNIKDTLQKYISNQEILDKIEYNMINDILNMEKELQMAVIQTAYANGASTKFIVSCAIPVVCVKTGVKYLLHEASKYDIGIYFEANGHGSVSFSKKFWEFLEMCSQQIKRLPNLNLQPLLYLKSFSLLCNIYIGDAVTNMFMVITCLQQLNMKPNDWITMYDELFTIMGVLTVPNKNIFKTYDQERRCSEPPGQQEAIDSAVCQYECGRAFIRPSGTEDAVRIFAEAATEQDAQELYHLVSTAIRQSVSTAI